MTISFKCNPFLSGIGVAARISGLTQRAVRLYEERGLIETARTERGARGYDAGTIQRLTFIATARAMGFSLAEIGQVLDAGDRHGDEEHARRLRTLITTHHEQAVSRLARIRTLAPKLGVPLATLDERPSARADNQDRPALVAAGNP
ncbi:MAG: transcriptional regulator, MerR family [Caulobacter sp.]|nr:transcriptional regulator, MerR family [Caulobacter sp.]